MQNHARARGPDLDGRVALVTGAGRGIGRAVVEHLLAAGAKVALFDLDPDAARDAADELRPLGEVLVTAGDVADEADVAAAVARVAETWGHLDIAVNNAALADPAIAPIEALDRADWQRVLDVNLTGPMLVVKHALPHLRRRGGAVVNIASTRAHQSEPNTEAYSASKGGLVALTHALAVSLGPEVRVNCVSPGWIDTRDHRPRAERARALEALSERDHAQHPAGRAGRPGDVAALCVYLASDAAGFITGQDLIVDGGMTRKMIYEP